MDQIAFYKMSGSGNDFIIIDNRNRVVDENNLQNFIDRVCRRKISVGADGLILVEESENVDFKWRFFNSDGSSAEMCGNGARCVARFAYLNEISGTKVSFETKAGIVSAQVKNDEVKIKMPDPIDLKIDYNLELKNGLKQVCSVNTGVPHVVITVDDIDDVEVVKTGREIRFHDSYAPAGTNVNFIWAGKDNAILIRTYERGVEDETLACGTGSVAAAIIMHYKLKGKSPVKVITRGGGCLYIYLEENDGRFYNVFLEGDARVIYKGYLWKDAFTVDG